MDLPLETNHFRVPSFWGTSNCFFSKLGLGICWNESEFNRGLTGESCHKLVLRDGWDLETSTLAIWLVNELVRGNIYRRLIGISTDQHKHQLSGRIRIDGYYFWRQLIGNEERAIGNSSAEMFWNYLSIHLSIDPSIQPSIYESIHLSIYPSIYLSIYPSIYLSIYLWI